MSQIFDADGNALAVTVIQAGPAVISDLKTTERDGYQAVQLGYGQDKKSQPKFKREFRTEGIEEEFEVGQNIDVSVFEAGDLVTVTGTSKGKGFAGTIKRHNFSRGPKTHGSHNYRAPGSIGATYPQHVFKGKRMAGRMGGAKTTVKDLTVVHIDVDKGLLALKGAVPGARRGLILIKGAN